MFSADEQGKRVYSLKVFTILEYYTAHSNQLIESDR